MNIAQTNPTTLALRISQILLAIIVAAIVAFTGLAISLGAWQLYVLVGVLIGAAAAAAVSWHLANTEQVHYGILFLNGAVAIVAVATSLLLEGVSFYAAVMLLMLIWLTSSLGLDDRWRSGSIVVAVVGAIALIVLDLYGLDYRLSTSGIEIIFIIFTVIVTLLFTGFVLSGYRTYSLQAKFVTAVVVLAITSIAITTFFVTLTIRDLATEQIGRDLHNVAEAKAGAIGEVVARQVSLLQTFQLSQVVVDSISAANAIPALSEEEQQALDQRWHRGDEEVVGSVLDNPVARELERLLTSFPDFHGLVVVDKQGGTVAASEPPHHYYQREEIWWRATFNEGDGRIFIGTPDVHDNHYHVTVALPFFEANGEFAGALKGEFVLNGLSELLSTTDELGETGQAGLVIGTREYLANNGSIEERPIFFTSEQTAQLNTRVFINSNFDGTPSFISKAPVRTIRGDEEVASLYWSVIAHQSEQEALRLVSVQQRTQILIGVIVVLIGGIVAAAVGRLVSAPILRLSEVARRIESGDRTVRAEIASGDEIGTLALTFNSMVDRLHTVEQNLELRVAERTRALEASARVSRSLSTILDREALIPAVVKLTQQAFNYYHVQMYLLDENTGDLHLVGATGQAGQKILQQGHVLSQEDGVVGRAAYANAPVLVEDVRQDANWRFSDLLPDTQTEAAVPIAIGDRVLGVLDIQDTEVGSLRQRDIELLEFVANQVAIALQNAQAYEKIQQDAQWEAMLDDITQKIRQTTDVESAIRVAASNLGRALDSAQTSVRLRDNGEKSNGRG